jgi:hypothetical protein
VLIIICRTEKVTCECAASISHAIVNILHQ